MLHNPPKPNETPRVSGNTSNNVPSVSRPRSLRRIRDISNHCTSKRQQRTSRGITQKWRYTTSNQQVTRAYPGCKSSSKLERADSFCKSTFVVELRFAISDAKYQLLHSEFFKFYVRDININRKQKKTIILK